MAEQTTSTQKKILIGTPCYGGVLTEGYFRSFLNSKADLEAHNIQVDITTLACESLITRARNSIVALFLSDPSFTHLLFIDADIAFPAQLIRRLVESNKLVVGAAYPKKAINYNSIVNNARSNPNMSPSTIQQMCLDYVVNFHTPLLNNVFQHEGGFLKVKELGTGFLLIQRETFDILKIKYPNDTYTNDVAAYNELHPDMKNNFWLFFDCIKDKKSNRYLSEDYAFCQKCEESGIPIWLDIFSPLTHIGVHMFEGNVISIFKPADDPDVKKITGEAEQNPDMMDELVGC